MAVETVGLLSPGDMGHAVGRALREHGLDVITCLDGRSDRTRALSVAARLRDLPSLDDLVDSSDLVLSILVPAEAVGVCVGIAAAAKRTGKDVVFADCNAVSPQTAARMDAMMREAGGRYVDGSIIGGPPRPDYASKFYVSGPHVSVMSELHGRGIDVCPLGDAVGRASAIKMCYASVTKGTPALWLAQLAAAEALGVSEELAAELRDSRPEVYEAMEKGLPRLPANAFRWMGEMEEIGTTFAGVGVSPGFHEASAEMYRLLSETPFASEAPEEIDQSRTLQQTVAAVVAQLEVPEASETHSALRHGSGQA
jgi:3-hydroxyisobutyrate dehydrogenase-like beta-hydroxyacid dehydrogenase